MTEGEVSQVSQNFTTFANLINEQFVYGAKKYSDKDNASRETTDILFDTFGAEWLYGTICKYTFRYDNVHREKDLLKIATYAYLLWLKRGFFDTPNGSDTARDTNVAMKSLYYTSFMEKVMRRGVVAVAPRIESIRHMLMSFVDNWDMISENNLTEIFILCFYEWNEKFSHIAGQDSDTNNKDDS